MLKPMTSDVKPSLCVRRQNPEILSWRWTNCPEVAFIERENGMTCETMGKYDDRGVRQTKLEVGVLFDDPNGG